MTDLNPLFLTKAPFPWFGGKSGAADLVWRRLGDVAHYVEPFFGSGAVLLARPHTPNRANFSETVNDADGLLVNFWRAIQHDPDAVAQHASYPVTEADLYARVIAALEWRASGALDRLSGSWDYYDARIAGWWAWGIACTIGLSDGFSGKGAWFRGDDGKLTRKRDGESIPQDKAGCCISKTHPQISGNGYGVNHPALRESGIAPHVAMLRFAAEGALEESMFHPFVMPRLRAWFAALAARLRHVRILNRDWARVVRESVLMTRAVRNEDCVAGVFLDPPYAQSERDPGLYAVESDVSADVREWCLKHGDNPKIRIALAGFSGEGHEILERHGWTCEAWFKPGYLKGGMGNMSAKGNQQHRERIWFSPYCLRDDAHQMTLF